MELAAIIIGLAIRRWKLPPQQGDTIYSDCKSLTDVLKSSAPPLSKHPAKLPFLQAVLHHLQALRPQRVTLDWTKSHPERRLKPEQYANKDWGILLADCAASNHPIPTQIRVQQHIQLSLPMLLQASIDPSTWFVGLPSGTPRMSSPIILKRDLTTFTYLANKRNLRGLSLHLLQKNLETTSTILRPARDHPKARHWLERRWLPLCPLHPGPPSQVGQRTMPPLPCT